MHVLFAGGGTGGHLIPALNIARELLDRHPEARIDFIGTQRGLEKDLVPREGFELTILPVIPLSRSLSLDLLRFPFALLKSFFITIGIIRKGAFDAVVSTGGFVSGPAILAGWIMRTPVIICEQNSYPGLTNRVGSVFAKRVILGLPKAERYLWRKSRAILLGNPVRLERSEKPIDELKREFGLSSDTPIVLVTGGSQGSARINSAVLEMLNNGLFPKEAQLLWQTGMGKYEEIKKAVGDAFAGVRLFPFITPMSKAYVIADLIVSRCGALTLSEISFWGLPSILVPYPFAAGNHQKINALTFIKEGAGILIEDRDLNGVSISEAISMLISDPQRRSDMAKKAKSLGRPDALKKIVDEIEIIITKSKKRKL